MNNPRTDCAEYIKKLIAAASEDSEAYSDDPMKIYQRVQDQAGFKLRNHEFGGSANREGNKRVVYIEPVPMVSDPRQREHAEYKYANTALNELMHHARKSGFYSDRTLAVAAFGLLTPEERAKHPLPKSPKEIPNSKYFHPLFKLHCRSITGE